MPNLDLHRIQMELKAPAAGLLIVALLNTAFWCFVGVVLLLDFKFPLTPSEVLGAVAAMVGVLLTLAVLMNGARHLRRLTGYEWCIGASILAMIPWAATVVIGFPVGLWAFRTLRRAEVRDAFLKRSLEREQSQRRRPRPAGRDWVTLTREQVEHDDLPDVCMVCGGPAHERINKTFHHEPEWVVFLLLLGVIPGLIALAFTSRTMRVACPVCPDHRHHWRTPAWVAGAGWLVMPLLAVLGFGIEYVLTQEITGIGPTLGVVAGLVLWLGPLIYLASSRVSAKKITLHDITFERVAPEFTRAAAGIGAAAHVPGPV